MRVEDVVSRVQGIPHTRPRQGRLLHKLVVRGGYTSCLELGFAHGVGSAYIASALDELGGGRLISVDTKEALARNPRADSVVARVGLSQYIEFVFHDLSYTWYLMQHISEAKPNFDFCFLDGAHTWDVDGFAFFLVASLLKPGGLIVFDDLNWSYASSPSLGSKDFVRRMSPERREMPQVRKVFELLVKQDPRFEAWEKDGWGYAKKLRD